ncbi:MAG: OmpA family protein [Zoogloeaceae bacterium]|jgi:peptidoglycan-associated lipoprotein|nr:OmpA family protein [Zoogloeaceae bacterium]
MPLNYRSILLLACFPLLFGACASKSPVHEEKVTPPAVFKVHPGLLGQAVPPELQPIEEATVEMAHETDKAAPGAPAERVDTSGDGAKVGQYSVYFDYREATIKPDYLAALQTLGQQLAANAALSVQIEGNADERGSAHYNLNLGMRRAQAVKKALRAAGARSKQVRTVSYGDSRPRRQGKDEASWAENRRADVVLNEGKK